MGLHMRESGQKNGPVAVFLHGGGIGGWMWQRQMACFADFHCLAPDLPGHGQSRHVPFVTIAAAADAVLDAVERRRNGRKAIWIGFSLGAQLVLELLSRRPEALDRAVVISALVRPMRSMLPFLGAMAALSGPLGRQEWFARLQAKQLYIPAEQFAEYFEDSRTMDSETLRRVLTASLSYELPASFAQHRVPTLVLAGAKEKAALRRSAADIVHGHPSVQGAIIPGIGHGLPLVLAEKLRIIYASWLLADSLSAQLGIVPLERKGALNNNP